MTTIMKKEEAHKLIDKMPANASWMGVKFMIPDLKFITAERKHRGYHGYDPPGRRYSEDGPLGVPHLLCNC